MDAQYTQFKVHAANFILPGIVSSICTKYFLFHNQALSSCACIRALLTSGPELVQTENTALENLGNTPAVLLQNDSFAFTLAAQLVQKISKKSYNW